MSTLFQNIHSVDQSVDAAKAAIVQEIERLSSGGIDAAPSLTQTVENVYIIDSGIMQILGALSNEVMGSRAALNTLINSVG